MYNFTARNTANRRHCDMTYVICTVCNKQKVNDRARQALAVSFYCPATCMDADNSFIFPHLPQTPWPSSYKLPNRPAMVETSLHLRPSFSTFLQSDTNAGEDPLSYYNYQRLLRSQKVALLQEKRARAYVPGYKRPTGGPCTHTCPDLQFGAARGRVAFSSLEEHLLL